MAEQKFKNEIKESLDELVIPDLQNIICQFVQLTSVGGHQAGWWMDNCDFSIEKKDQHYINTNWYRAVHRISETDLTVWYATWDGPEISATFSFKEINDSLIEFNLLANVILTLSDNKNLSFHLDTSKSLTFN